MTHLSLQLRSENPPFGSDFRLAPGTHVRVGASPKADIPVPLPGVADVSLIIGRSGNGLLYVSQPDGSGVRYIEPPAIVFIAPYHFVVTESSSTPSTSTSSVRRRRTAKKQSAWPIVAGSLAALLFLGFVFAEFRSSSKPEISKPAAPAPVSSKLSEAPVETVAERQVTPDPSPIAPPPPEVPKPTLEAPIVVQEPAVAKILEFEELADKASATVYTVLTNDESDEPLSSGTAFAISADGLLVTNCHVIEGAKSIVVYGADNKHIPVERVVAMNPKADIALLSLTTATPNFLELGESGKMKIGASIAVYGAPHGLSGTLSTGIISARRVHSEFLPDSKFDPHIEFIQITAPISPGSSGSPVMNRQGQVIGVATLGIVEKNSQNLNFAVPATAVQKLRDDAAKGLASISPSITTPRPSKPAPRKPATTGDTEAAILNDRDMLEYDRLMDNEDYVGAMTHATALVAKYPGSARAHTAQGVALLGAQFHEQAEAALTKALKLDDQNHSTWYFCAVAQMAQKKFPEARRTFKRAVQLKPTHAASWKEIAAISVMLNDASDAISSLQKVRELNRPMYEKWLTLYSRIKDPSLALKTVLSHFGVQSSGESSTQREFDEIVISLITDYLSSQEQVDPLAELAHFSEVVNPYYEKGRRSKSQIMPHIQAFREQWPQRRFEFVRLEQADFLNGFNLEVTYVVRFTTISNRDQRTCLMRQTLHFTEDGNRRWRISAIKTHSN